MPKRVEGEYLPPGRFWLLAACIVVVGAGFAGYEGSRAFAGWRSGVVAPFCRQCSAFPQIAHAESPALYWATMGWHVFLVLLGLVVLAIGARMVFARLTGADTPPEPESDKDRQRRLDRMREEK